MFKIGQKIQIKQGAHHIQSQWIGKIGSIIRIRSTEYDIDPISPEDKKNDNFPAWLYEDEMILLEDPNEISIF